MKKHRSKIIIIILLSIFTFSVFAAIDRETEEYYGLNTIEQPYNGRIRQLIGFMKLNVRAIKSSGFEVYVLDDIITGQFGQKQYIWKKLDGTKLATKHMLGLETMYMKKGDIYLGKTSIAFLKVFRNGEEQTFSLL